MYAEWLRDPGRPVLLVDETRRAMHEASDEIVIFSCVCITASAAQMLMRAAAEARTRLPPDFTNHPIKGRDISRVEIQRACAPLIAVWTGALAYFWSVTLLATTSGAQKASERTTKCRILSTSIETGKTSIIQARELPAILHLLLAVGRSLGVGERVVEAIIDRSDQNGFGRRPRRLAAGTFEILGPGRLDNLMGGGKATLECPAAFRLIADCDQGPFRDLLILPDIVGHVLAKQTDARTLLRVLSNDPFYLLPLDLESAKGQLFRACKGPSRDA